MNKFTKRIIKSAKNRTASLVLGNAFGNLSELTEIFENVFLHIEISKNVFKKKNIIFIEDIDNPIEIPLLSMIFIDAEYLGKIGSLRLLMNKYSPVIMIGSGEFIEKTYSKFLNDHRYEIVELFKDYQIWKMKK